MDFSTALLKLTQVKTNSITPTIPRPSSYHHDTTPTTLRPRLHAHDSTPMIPPPRSHAHRYAHGPTPTDMPMIQAHDPTLTDTPTPSRPRPHAHDPSTTTPRPRPNAHSCVPRPHAHPTPMHFLPYFRSRPSKAH
ncbi:uncharacterized protein LOC134772390 [Penaeus indicus]|uniref:uncharacterized protein LOC134772390 n=1 Tax=Penaeus indicus TaxID=29960 RepID=UPI00300D6B37